MYNYSMYTIVGLGNPGSKYQNNRHNVGQMFADYLVNELTGKRVNEFKLKKTDCYMNQSGRFIKNLKLEIKNLVVVHDDLDIPLGKFKIQKGQGPRLHNGINSIENTLGSKDFWRIRIGVDNRKPDNWTNGEAYVLENFTPEEKEIIIQTFPQIYSRLAFLTEDR